MQTHVVTKTPPVSSAASHTSDTPLYNTGTLVSVPDTRQESLTVKDLIFGVCPGSAAAALKGLHVLSTAELSFL